MLSKEDEAYYQALADQTERGELTPTSETIERGNEATETAQQLLMEATGTNTVEDAIRHALKEEDRSSLTEAFRPLLQNTFAANNPASQETQNIRNENNND